MNLVKLPLEERVSTGCSHALRLVVAEVLTLASAAGATTALTINVKTYQARDIVNLAFFDLVTPFDGGATSGLTLKFGYNGATVDDDDAFIAARSIHVDATEIFADAGGLTAVATDTVDSTYGSAEATVLESLRTTVNEVRARRFFAAQEAGTFQLILTSTGANLSALTTGEVVLYFNVIRPTELRGING